MFIREADSGMEHRKFGQHVITVLGIVIRLGTSERWVNTEQGDKLCLVIMVDWSMTMEYNRCYTNIV